ncbi:CapA family protein [Cohnella panacarvi]|uniref:CapA family protein n=1 Tax=Cohnella panacarvi TaxID=400776 RepID=UPI00047BE4B1|nr:CapA family protein [Cohnella panacarvi]
MNLYRKAAWIGIVAMALLTGACSNAAHNPAGDGNPLVKPSEPPLIDTSDAPPAAVDQPPQSTVREATLIAVGDIMVHMPQLPAYYDAASKRYSFNPWFDQVKPIFQTGDWVFGNLETPLAGQALKYTGYPRFNAPAELATALVDAGFDVVSTANNHSMDRGFPGVVRTLENVRKSGLVPVGTAVDEEDAGRLTIVEREGIKLGFLAYTYGTNGIPIPEDKPFSVNLIDSKKIVAEIASLRSAGADVVAVSLHFGLEYHRMPSKQQIQLAHKLIASGADIVLGSHPHVVQPLERVSIPASESVSGIARNGVVIYSLGNFISNQTGDWKDVGLILKVNIAKTELADGTSVIELKQVETIPTWVHIESIRKQRYYTIIPLEQALHSRNNPKLEPQDYADMRRMLDGTNKLLKQKVGSGD